MAGFFDDPMKGGLGNFFAGLGIGGDPSKIYGSKPVVPTVGDETNKAISDSLAALPGAENLASKVNAFTQAQKNAMMSFVTPNWQRNLGMEGDQIEKMLSGVLPSSDAAQSQLQSVSSALSGGFGGTPAGTNLVARDLGLRQLDVIEKGMAANDRWLKTAESMTAPMFDFTKLFPTPQEEFSRDWQSNVIASAPDPVARGESDEWNALIGEVLSIYGGGAGYKNTYNPGYGGSNNGGGGGGYGSPDSGSYWYSAPQGQNITINNDPSIAAGTDVPASGY